MKRIVMIFMAAALFAGAGAALTAETVREGRPAISGRFVLGRIDGDAAAVAGIAGEYAATEHIAYGAGYVYVDGYMTQAQGAELFVRAYFRGKPLDIYAQGGVNLAFEGETPEFSVTVRAGVEWRAGFGLLLGAETCMLVQDGGRTGFLFGPALGFAF